MEVSEDGIDKCCNFHSCCILIKWKERTINLIIRVNDHFFFLFNYVVALIYDGVVADNRLARMEFCNVTVEDINIDNVMR